MANRFLATNYYKSPFVRGLKGSLKGLYSFIICDCSPSGIWSKDMEAASMYIGFNVTDNDFEENFIKTGKAIYVGRGKYFFPDFIEHQYPKGLQENNSAHKNIIFELKKLELLNDENRLKTKKNEDPLKHLNSPLIGSKVIDIGNSKGNGNNNLEDLEVNNSKSEGKKKKVTYPDKEYCYLELPTDYFKQAIENIYIQIHEKKSDEEIQVMWDSFKLENFTGTNYYENDQKIFTHFLRTTKSYKNGHTVNTTSNKSNSKVDALKKW
jgi:hypothetical protein